MGRFQAEVAFLAHLGASGPRLGRVYVAYLTPEEEVSERMLIDDPVHVHAGLVVLTPARAQLQLAHEMASCDAAETSSTVQYNAVQNGDSRLVQYQTGHFENPSWRGTCFPYLFHLS